MTISLAASIHSLSITRYLLILDIGGAVRSYN